MSREEFLNELVYEDQYRTLTTEGRVSFCSGSVDRLIDLIVERDGIESLPMHLMAEVVFIDEHGFGTGGDQDGGPVWRQAILKRLSRSSNE